MTEPLEKVRVGMAGRTEVVVTRELTVGAHVDGMPFVYGTPMMILAMEIASGESVKAHLPPGWATVGSEVNVRHLAHGRGHCAGRRGFRAQHPVRGRGA
jgi:predicted thioesterase